MANSYQEVIKTAAAITASSGLYQLVKKVNIGYVYYGLGAFMIGVSIVLIYGIKDVITEKEEERWVPGSIVEASERLVISGSLYSPPNHIGTGIGTEIENVVQRKENKAK
mgnify:FL=1